MTRLPAAMNLTAMQQANRFNRTAMKALEAERTQSWQQHRASVEDGVTVPTIRVPHRRVQLRIGGRCRFCSGSVFETHLPAVDLENPKIAYRGVVSCLLCSRTVANLVIGSRQPITYTTCVCGAQKVLDEECTPCYRKRKAREAMAAYRARLKARVTS